MTLARRGRPVCHAVIYHRAALHLCAYSHITSVLHAGGTRTCIHTPAAPLEPSEISEQRMDEVLAGASLVYSDGRLAEAALKVAQAARRKGIPVLVEAERLRPGLNELLAQADFVVTSASFPQAR